MKVLSWSVPERMGVDERRAEVCWMRYEMCALDIGTLPSGRDGSGCGRVWTGVCERSRLEFFQPKALSHGMVPREHHARDALV